MNSWRWASPDLVRARIASLVLPAGPADARLGSIVLRDHQVDAVHRLRHAMDRFGGALLADEVGLGKTYAALAAARDASTLLIVAPASLSTMWQSALDRSELHGDFISFETLSRRSAETTAYDTVIVDEAHHARNPGTQRFDNLAALTRSARVLLLSATPVHNAAADLRALLSLFLGSRADQLTPAEMGACIVRRTRRDVRDTTTPARTPPVWCTVDGPAEVLRAISEIPPPCPPRDGAAGGVLVTLSLVRAWASSEAALRAALRRRVARAESLADALAAGRHPTRAELRAWVVGDDATQLAFPELVSDAAPHETRGFLDAVQRHVGGARRALSLLAANAGATDNQRAAIIRDLRKRHQGQRIVVFSQFADTVHDLFARLRDDGGIAAVTANGALVAGGPLTRTQVLARFAPEASGARPPSRAEAVEVLIATDLLSEGLNLQDASVVIHMDLPWTAARLTQRLGRVWRIGSLHQHVHEYAVAPPAPADHVLRLMDILARKAGTAWSAIGEPVAALLANRTVSPAIAGSDRTRANEELQTLLRNWSHRLPDEALYESGAIDQPRVEVSGVRASFSGWIAVVDDRGTTRILGARGESSPTSDPCALLEIVVAASGAPCVSAPSRVERAVRTITTYLDAARAASDAGISSIGSRARNHAAARIAALAASAPPHRRLSVSRLAAAARQAVGASRSAGAERLLAALVSSSSSDDPAIAAETWLERVIDASAAPLPNENAADSSASDPRLRALIVLVPHQQPD